MARAESEQTSLNIVLHVTERVADSIEGEDKWSSMHDLSDRIERLYGGALGDESRISVAVESDPIQMDPLEYDTAKAMCRAWEDRRESDPDVADSNCLIVSPAAIEYWEYGGYGFIGGPASVAIGGSFIDAYVIQWLIMHEIGHNLGLTHDDARVWRNSGEPDQASIMVSDVPDDAERIQLFSSQSRQKLQQLYGNNEQ